MAGVILFLMPDSSTKRTEREQAQQIIAILVQRHLFYASAFTSPTDTFYETRLSASTRPIGRLRPDIWKKIDD